MLSLGLAERNARVCDSLHRLWLAPTIVKPSHAVTTGHTLSDIPARGKNVEPERPHVRGPRHESFLNIFLNIVEICRNVDLNPSHCALADLLGRDSLSPKLRTLR